MHIIIYTRKNKFYFQWPNFYTIFEANFLIKCKPSKQKVVHKRNKAKKKGRDKYEKQTAVNNTIRQFES